jgi:hypothetical protein
MERAGAITLNYPIQYGPDCLCVHVVLLRPSLKHRCNMHIAMMRHTAFPAAVNHREAYLAWESGASQPLSCIQPLLAVG